MGFTLWVYHRQAEGLFLKVPARTYNEFSNGSAPLPGVQGEEALLAELVVELQDRKAIAITQTHYRRLPLTADGFLDSDASHAEARLVSDLAEIALAEGTVIEQVTAARGQLLKRRLEVLFRWEPTAKDLDALSQLVNRRAGRHLMGRSGLRLVK